MAVKYRICDEVSQEPLVWLVEYNESGEVRETSEDINEAIFFHTANERNEVITLINGNGGNSFIGSVPPPPHK